MLVLTRRSLRCLLILACRMACYYALCWIQLMVNLRILGRGEGAPPRFVCLLISLYFSFLGTRPVRLIRVQIQRNPAILALSSRSWLNYTHQNLMHFTPLIFDNLDYAWSFSAELSPEGLIGISGSVLR